jgi:hypothetical protein
MVKEALTHKIKDKSRKSNLKSVGEISIFGTLIQWE